MCKECAPEDLTPIEGCECGCNDKKEQDND